ncbi:Uma2 family endonuclease [Jiangella anatolica]|uniref:Uma2 family endonuclease n=1 Tax=Jiangella anatolica TaxID=2670374 RepID=A0A2W2CKF7_9ACTN|nr:Uma2 family endonuclease [Jiangella anatolica]PZF85946.1 Uma2 family endonuclease [Jiangella anatolica]
MNPANPLARDPGSLGFRSTDLRLLPADGPRFELIEGCFVVSPPPTAAEAEIWRWLANTLEVSNRGSPVVVDRGQPVRIGDHDEVRPDVVVADVAMAETTPIPVGALALVVEVVSPSSVLRDTVTKRALYARAGVPAYWIVVVRGSPPWIEIAELRLDPATGAYAERTPPTSAPFSTDHPWPLAIDVPALAARWSALGSRPRRDGEEA